MATDRKRGNARVAEIEGEIAEAIERGGADKAANAILDVLEQLRKIGVGRSQYNLENPYDRGLSHNHAHGPPLHNPLHEPSE